MEKGITGMGAEWYMCGIKYSALKRVKGRGEHTIFLWWGNYIFKGKRVILLYEIAAYVFYVIPGFWLSVMLSVWNISARMYNNYTKHGLKKIIPLQWALHLIWVEIVLFWSCSVNVLITWLQIVPYSPALQWSLLHGVYWAVDSQVRSIFCCYISRRFIYRTTKARHQTLPEPFQYISHLLIGLLFPESLF